MWICRDSHPILQSYAKFYNAAENSLYRIVAEEVLGSVTPNITIKFITLKVS